MNVVFCENGLGLDLSGPSQSCCV